MLRQIIGAGLHRLVKAPHPIGQRDRGVAAVFQQITQRGQLFARLDAALLQMARDQRRQRGGRTVCAGMAAVAVHDPDNAHSVPYMTFTIGIGYNVDKLKERLGDVPVNTWDIVFKPENAKKLQDCGIAFLDSPSEIMASALKYLGKDPNSESPDDLKAASDLMMSIRPYVRYFHSSQYIDDLGNGEICVAVGYSGDVFIAKDSAEKANAGVKVDYVIPKEGALSSFDLLAIPADAQHPDNAHKFIDFMMRPEIIAAVSDFVFYANLNKEATQFVSDDVKTNPNIYPPDDVKKNLFALKAHTPDFDRELTRAWTRIKTGQ